MTWATDETHCSHATNRAGTKRNGGVCAVANWQTKEQFKRGVDAALC